MEAEVTENESEVVEAGHVYLLMENEFRISRNSRASWYFKHLNTVIDISDNTKDKHGDALEVLHISSRTVLPQEDTRRTLYRITPNTTVTFFAKKYRFVFVLDVSPSVAAVNLGASQVVFAEVFSSLQTTIRGLIQQFKIPGSETVLTPQIFVTVIAHTPLVNCKTNQVLIQGCLVTPNNVEALLELLRHKLDKFETTAASSMQELLAADIGRGSDDMKLTGGLFDDIIERPTLPDPSLHLMSPDVAFITMMRSGILALQLLPGNSAAGMVVITDGVVGLPEPGLFESLMSQLRHNTMACSFIPVGGSFNVSSAGLGHVPYTELLQFLATATFGAYFARIPEADSHPKLQMNAFQLGLLTWSFHKALGGAKIDSHGGQPWEELNEDLAWPFKYPTYLEDKRHCATPLTSKKHPERSIHTGISNLISCRLREGYTIKDVAVSKGDSQIEVKLVLPWRDNVWITYLARSSWPLNTPKRHTIVELTIEGSYDFLHDVTCPQKKPLKSAFRTALVKQYWHTLQGMSETDKMLVHLQSFSGNPAFYKVPGSVQKGVPLFYLPPNSPIPQVNIQHSSKDAVLNQFATFWRPILLLDVNIWQKWMHTHRIGVILKHDVPLGKHLHTPNSSGRFHSITCRQAITGLNFLLAQKCTFVLMENHSYIQLLFSDPDKPPTSFFVLRVTSKPPCLILRLAFLGGTPGQLREKTVRELESSIGALMFPQRGTTSSQADEKPPVRKLSNPVVDLPPTYIPPLQRLRSEIPCCINMHKPIEKILVRYERLPPDFLTLEAPLPTDPGHHVGAPAAAANRVGSGLFTSLARYLHHQRWVWSIQHGSSLTGASISMQATGRILATLTKIRLQEGFHFAHASAGIVNMVVEIELKAGADGLGSGLDFDDIQWEQNPDLESPVEEDRPECEQATEDANLSSHSSSVYPCVMQYVIFPPHTTTTRESVSEDEQDEETTEADGELQLVTEVWVEPQYGMAINSTPERKHFDGLDFVQLAHALFPTDFECISTMLTFEHLNLMCQNISIPQPSFAMSAHGLVPVESCPLVTHRTDTTIQHVPFAFDLMQLLPKCQQVELLFSTFTQDMSTLPGVRLRSGTITQGNTSAESNLTESNTPNDTLFSLFLESLKDLHDREVFLSDFECEQLVSLVKQRERDVSVNPLPFLVEEPTLAENLDTHDNESTMSLSTNYSQTSNATPLSNSPSSCSFSFRSSQPMQTFKQAIANKWQRKMSYDPSVKMSNKNKGVSSRRASSTDIPTHTDGGSIEQILSPERQSVHETETKVVPQVVPHWRCFIKSISMTHVLLCVTPATYSDLRVLVQGQGIIQDPSKSDAIKRRSSKACNIDAEKMESSPQHTKSMEDLQRKITSPKDMKPHSVETSPKRAPTGARRSLSEEFSEQVEADQPSVTTTDAERNDDTLHVMGDADILIGGEDDFEKTDDSQSALESQEERTTCPEPCPADLNDCPAVPDTHRSIHLPVYIYNCPLSQLTKQLVNKWTYERVADVFQDLTVKPDIGENEELGNGLISHTSLRNGEQSREHSEESRRRWISEEGHKPERPVEGRRHHHSDGDLFTNQIQHEEMSSQEDIFGDDELQKHCTLISEHFFRNFVTGLYKSLLKNQDVMCQDVDSAINRICEESMPMEIDITPYVHNVCGHIRGIVEKINHDRMVQDDLQKTLPKVHEQNTPMSPSDASKSSMKNPLREFTTLSSVQFPLSRLHDGTVCESVRGLHELIKSQFAKIMRQHFKPIPSNNNFFFYCPPSFQDNSEPPDDTLATGVMDKLDDTNLSNDPNILSDESDLFVSSDAEDADLKSDHDSVASVKDTASMSSVNGDDLDMAEILEDDEDDPPPLFIYLMCSVRTGNDMLKSIAINDIPTCLAELESCLEDVPLEIDLASMYITLDMICLKLPPEGDDSLTSLRPCFNRMMSHASTSYEPTGSPPDTHDNEDAYSYVATTEGGTLKPTVSDPLDNLPKFQNEAMTDCKQQINWLLRDEIASALRHIVPVTVNTLEMVAMHVKDSESQEKPKCIHKKVPLQFVYGPDRSLQPFIEDFELMGLPGYHLNKEGHYYYLSLDRMHHDSLAHAFAITSALCSIEPRKTMKMVDCRAKDLNESTGTSSEPPASSAAISADIERTTSNESSSQQKPVQPPTPEQNKVLVFPGKTEVIQLEKPKQDQMVSPTSVSSVGAPSEVQDSKEDGKALETSGDGEIPGMDNSVEVIPEKDGDKEVGKLEENTFRPEDIRISVIRPSPVKEAPSLGNDEKEEKEETFSEDTSGSSIQVLDDSPLTEREPQADVSLKPAADEVDMDAALQRDLFSSQNSQKFENPDDMHETRSLHGPVEGCKSDDAMLADYARVHRSHSEILISSHDRETGEHNMGALSPLLVETIDGHRLLKKAHSGPFEKPRSQSQIHYTHGTGSKHSGHNTPSRHPSGPQTPTTRSRHQSGQTPHSGSIFYASSRSSVGDEDYDGDSDSSEIEDNGVMLSFGDLHIRRPLLPNFWLIMKVEADKVDVYFHTRDPGDIESEEFVKERNFFSLVISNIKNICKVVNQRLLLEDMYATHSCNKLLVPEADEDVKWSQVTLNQFRRHEEESDESDTDTPQEKYLEASLRFMPGYFACDMVWSTHFILPSRLKTVSGRSISLGVQALRSVVDRFAVTNRKNMFVIKERNGNVFYLRLMEQTHNGSHRGSILESQSVTSQRWEEDSFSASRSSSMMSLATKKPPDKSLDKTPDKQQPDTEDEHLDGPLPRRMSTYDEDILSRSMSKRELDTITLTVHGITSVGDEIKIDLVQLLQKKLNEKILDILAVTLSRNQMTKLTMEDVQFIQPPQPAGQIVRLTIPAGALLQQFALGYYLRQNLQQFLFTPKYADHRYQFCNYTQPNQTDALPIPESQVFVYNRPQPAGGKGIACLYLSFVDGRGTPVTLMGTPKPSPYAYRDPLDPSMFETMVSTTLYEVQRGAKVPDFVDDISDSDQVESPGWKAQRDQKWCFIVQICEMELFGTVYSETVTKDPFDERPLFRPTESNMLLTRDHLFWETTFCDTYGAHVGGFTEQYGFEWLSHAGPTALVQFAIWERGDVDIHQLTDRLVLAMRHTVSDVITEYRVLTSPICEAPMHYTRGQDTPVHSAPPSPSVSGTMLAEMRNLPSHDAMKKQAPDTSRTPKERPTGAFTLFSDAFKSKTAKDGTRPSVSPSPIPAGQTSPPNDLDLARQRETDLKTKMQKYEDGDRGILQHMFCSTTLEWFRFCTSIGVPSIQCNNYTLLSRFSLDYILMEMKDIVNRIVADVTPKVFKCTTYGADTAYLPYMPVRPPIQSQEGRTESSLDFSSLQQAGSSWPGRPCYFIVVGRNIGQWRSSINYQELDEDAVLDQGMPTNPKTHKSYQRFVPFDPSHGAERQDSSSSAGTVPSTPASVPPPTPLSATSSHTSASSVSYNCYGEPAFVPRQRFLLMTVKDKKLSLFTYNWTQDLHNSLSRQLGTLIQWHNARTQLLTSILLHKGGLFQHSLYGEIPQQSQDCNPFLQSARDVDLLVKYHRNVPMQHFQNRSQNRLHHHHSSLPPFEDIYRDGRPAHPMHLTKSASMRDPLHRHGIQMLELRGHRRTETEQLRQLGEVYMLWQQRMGTTYMPVGEDVLELLKVSSRLVHSVATPILFSPAWRSKVLTQDTKMKRKLSQVSVDSRPRSRHSSGASMRSKRSDSMEGKKRNISAAMESPEVIHKREMHEEEWHIDLRKRFIQQYVQYLQTLGFVQIRTRPASPKRGLRAGPGEKSHADRKPAISPNNHYLQKTLPGGIMLVEIGFKEVYFFIHVYTFECSRLPVGKTVNHHLSVIFTDECDKFKDLTHVHSFAHDFHLRIIQIYVTGMQAVFKHGYHLVHFLRDFIRFYPYVPSFSHNFILEDHMTIQDTVSSGSQLFEYMLNHDKMYGMRAIRMLVQGEDDDLMENEYALVMQYQCSGNPEVLESLKMRVEDFDVGLVITHDSPAGSRSNDFDKASLKLKYYVMMTSKKNLFPKQTLEKKLGVFKCYSSLKAHPANSDMFERHVIEVSGGDSLGENGNAVAADNEAAAALPTPRIEEGRTISQPTAQHLGMSKELGSWEEMVNYLGYSNKTQAFMYNILLEQAAAAREKIHKMVLNAMSQCRRDLLWQRMLVTSRHGEEEGRRKRRSERQTDQESDMHLSRLSFTEFEELLKIVTKVRLCDIDSRLTALHNMSTMWHHGLVRVLTNKYPENHRHFTRADGFRQYVVVLNPNFLDAFIMLMVDSESDKADLCAVYREPMVDPYHTPTNLNLPALAFQNHMEGFVNACCYHMWTGFIQ